MPSSQCDPGPLGQHGEYLVCPAGGGRNSEPRRESGQEAEGSGRGRLRGGGRDVGTGGGGGHVLPFLALLTSLSWTFDSEPGVIQTVSGEARTQARSF